MLRVTVRNAMQSGASELRETRHNLGVSLAIDRVLMTESRIAIESSLLLMRRVRQEESASRQTRSVGA